MIDFREMPESEASSFALPWDRVRTAVWPERIVKDAVKYPRMVNEWWKFWNARPVMRGAIAELAEAEGHHPALLTEWGKVTVSWWTHKIRGLHRNDFIMAAKTDALVAERYPSGNDATTS